MIDFLWFGHKIMLFGGESVVFGVGSAQSLRFLLETNQRQSILLLWVLAASENEHLDLFSMV